MKIIREKRFHECVVYARVFDHSEDDDSGYSFPCDESGNVEVSTLTPAARANYKRAMRECIDRGVVDYPSRWTESAIGECHCGAHVELGGFTNTCERCGTDYNWCGQELAPREQWGEETGEALCDIERIG